MTEWEDVPSHGRPNSQEKKIELTRGSGCFGSKIILV